MANKSLNTMAQTNNNSVNDASISSFSESSLASASSSPSKHVTFGVVEITEVPYTIGDNPSVSEGPPISIAWKAQDRTVFFVDFFERYRPSRRPRWKLRLSSYHRQELLLRNGYSMDEIVESATEAARVRKERFQTHSQLFQRCGGTKELSKSNLANAASNDPACTTIAQ